MAWLVAGVMGGGGLMMMWLEYRQAYQVHEQLQTVAGMGAAEGTGVGTDAKREAVRTLISSAMDRRSENSPDIPPLAREPAPGEFFDFTAIQRGEAIRLLGDRYLVSGRIAAALKAYCEALALNSRNVNVWQSIGQCYLRYADRDMARLALETAVQLGSANPEVFTLLACLYREEGRLTEALALWEQCRRLATPDSLSELNEGLALIEHEDFASAIARLARYRREHPSDVEAARALAFALAKSGLWKDARSTLKETLARDPDSPGLHADAAAAAARMWLAEEAVTHLETLADITSSGVVYHFMLSPAFSGFRRTEIGKKLESALMVASLRETVTPEQLKSILAVNISPRFSLSPHAPRGVPFHNGSADELQVE
ncbi:MAG: tetratricopeptide repeat protein [Kiritimatiellae bacterium]|nr:tetratricopeptide repeat protein [Kiritimatiellia bacterium]